MPSIAVKAARVGACQNQGSMGAQPSAKSALLDSIWVSVESDRLIQRAKMVLVLQQAAAAKAPRAGRDSMAPSGPAAITTPAKPSSTANQRAAPTRSLRTSAESITAITGAAK